MSVTWESARAWISSRAPWLIPAIGMTSASGAANYLVDTALWTNPAGNYLTPKNAAGMSLLFPDASGDQRERRVSGTTPVDITNGRLYWDGPALSGSVGAGVQYELASRPWQVIYNVFTRTLREFLLPDFSSLPVYPDADMEATGITGHTLVGAGSLTKDTTPGNVYSGARSLKFTAGAASDYLEEPSIIVKPGASEFGSVILSVVSGRFSFAVWDKTNDREIGTRVSSDLPGFMSLQRTFDVPSDCKQIAYRVYCSSASDEAYIDCFHGPYKQDDYVINAPSHLTKPSLLRKVVEASYTSYEDKVYDATSRVVTQWYPRDYYLRTNSAHANPYRFEMRRRMPQAEVWIETLRKGSSVYTPAFTAAGETSPAINIDEDLFGLQYLANLCKEILTFAPADVEATATLAQVMRSKGEGGDGLPALMAEYSKSLETPLQEPPYPVRSMRGI